MVRGSLSHAPTPSFFMSKSKRKDLRIRPYSFDEMTALIQRLERTKKRSGREKQAKIQIMIDEFKRYRKEIE